MKNLSRKVTGIPVFACASLRITVAIGIILLICAGSNDAEAANKKTRIIKTSCPPPEVVKVELEPWEDKFVIEIGCACAEDFVSLIDPIMKGEDVGAFWLGGPRKFTSQEYLKEVGGTDKVKFWCYTNEQMDALLKKEP